MLALALPILLFGGYTMSKPKPVVKTKIKGTIYVLPQTFLLNLNDGRYAKLTVALQLAPGQSDGAVAGSERSGGEGSPGTLPEEPLVREIVTDTVTNQNGDTLVSQQGRHNVQREVLHEIEQRTDVKTEAVLFPDLHRSIGATA